MWVKKKKWNKIEDKECCYKCCWWVEGNASNRKKYSNLKYCLDYVDESGFQVLHWKEILESKRK